MKTHPLQSGRPNHASSPSNTASSRLVRNFPAASTFATGDAPSSRPVSPATPRSTPPSKRKGCRGSFSRRPPPRGSEPCPGRNSPPGPLHPRRPPARRRPTALGSHHRHHAAQPRRVRARALRRRRIPPRPTGPQTRRPPAPGAPGLAGPPPRRAFRIRVARCVRPRGDGPMATGPGNSTITGSCAAAPPVSTNSRTPPPAGATLTRPLSSRMP